MGRRRPAAPVAWAARRLLKVIPIMCVHIHVYVCIYIYIYVYIYIYIYTFIIRYLFVFFILYVFLLPGQLADFSAVSAPRRSRLQTNGVNANGAAEQVIHSDRLGKKVRH